MNNNITHHYNAPLLNEAVTMFCDNSASTNEEPNMFTHPIFTQINKHLDTADKIIAVFLLGCMLSITPLVCSAAVIKAHTHAVQVPVMHSMQLKVLKRAVGGYNVMLTPVSALVPLPLRRR